MILAAKGTARESGIPYGQNEWDRGSRPGRSDDSGIGNRKNGRHHVSFDNLSFQDGMISGFSVIQEEVTIVVLEKVHAFSRTSGATCVSSKLAFVACLPNHVQHLMVIQSSPFIQLTSLSIFPTPTHHDMPLRSVYMAVSAYFQLPKPTPPPTRRWSTKIYGAITKPSLVLPLLLVPTRPSPLSSPLRLLLVLLVTIKPGLL